MPPSTAQGGPTTSNDNRQHPTPSKDTQQRPSMPNDPSFILLGVSVRAQMGGCAERGEASWEQPGLRWAHPSREAGWRLQGQVALGCTHPFQGCWQPATGNLCCWFTSFREDQGGAWWLKLLHNLCVGGINFTGLLVIIPRRCGAQKLVGQ